MPRRIWGIETEYGLTCAPVAGHRPPLDADEAARLLFRPVVALGRSTNVFLRNGGRLYLDVGSHPEYATAECDQLPDLLAQDRAGSSMLRDLAATANERLEGDGVDGRIHLFKNNLDAAGNSFGCHENYLVRRRPDFAAMVASLVPFLVTRQVVTGGGHVRVRGGRIDMGFSQRAGQMWDAMSSATTRSRPIVNTRDEPHADAELYRRLHVIVGDSNVAEGSTLVKVAATDMLLAMVEAGHRIDMQLVDPMSAIREVSTDIAGTADLELADGRRMTAVAIQRAHLEAVRAFAAANWDVGPWHAVALDLWDRALTAVETGNHSLVDTELDWAIKEKLVRRFEGRDGATVVALQRLLLAYHDITEGALQERMESRGLMRRFTTTIQVRDAVTHPPDSTRARLRGEFVGRAQDLRRDHTVDWVHLRLADPAHRTVMLTDPFGAYDDRVDVLLQALAIS
ncbi:MAG: Pup--protein ligase [Actinobacteria bacterium]|nr:Pup--protein ligase [Actinomycetota bacterium]